MIEQMKKALDELRSYRSLLLELDRRDTESREYDKASASIAELGNIIFQLTGEVA